MDFKKIIASWKRLAFDLGIQEDAQKRRVFDALTESLDNECKLAGISYDPALDQFSYAHYECEAYGEPITLQGYGSDQHQLEGYLLEKARIAGN